MKTTRKITAIGLALLMIIVCGASVFAEENQFTSNEAVPGGGAIVYDPKTAPADTNFTDGKAAPGGRPRRSDLLQSGRRLRERELHGQQSCPRRRSDLSSREITPAGA